MFNPLVDNFKDLSDNELENKITELSRKYFLAKNPALQEQVGAVLNMFKQEAITRRAIANQKIKEQNDDSGLDNLINIS